MLVKLAQARDSIRQTSQDQLQVISKLTNETENLRLELEEARLKLASKEQESQERFENVFQAHKIRSDSLTQQNLESLLHATNSHHAAIEAL